MLAKKLAKNSRHTAKLVNFSKRAPLGRLLQEFPPGSELYLTLHEFLLELHLQKAFRPLGRNNQLMSKYKPFYKSHTASTRPPGKLLTVVNVIFKNTL